MLPTGFVLIYAGDTQSDQIPGIPGNTQHLWDPSTGTLTATPGTGYDVFCSGHAFLGDGRLLISGGHSSNGIGLAFASTYDPFANVWARVPDMNAGRWYPTNTTLANGDMLVVSGNIDTTVGVNRIPQVFQAGSATWRDLTNAALSLDLYPRMHLLPDGRVFNSGPSGLSRALDTSGTGAWAAVATRNAGYTDYGSSVLYNTGKVLSIGGGIPATSAAEVIDLNQPAPAWRSVASMAIARRQLNATILADGKVLINGGTNGPGFNNMTTPVFPAEIWDPATETWTTVASAQFARIYHSVALLLPDGRVFTSGGNGHPEIEIYAPPYLFQGARPTITSAPVSVTYNQTFFVETADAASITKVTWIRLSSVTHAFNQDQRISYLVSTQGTGGLNVTAPSSGPVAPPGYYMLFILNGSGVPSVAKIVRLDATNPVPSLTSLVPSSAAAGGATFTLTVNGSGFSAGSTVRWNGAARATTVVSSTQLSATIPASDIAAAGTSPVTVANPAPGGGISNALTFTINAGANPVPALTSLSPSTAGAGGPAFTLTVNGSGFVAASTVRWNGANRTTTFVSSTQLQAAIPATDIATAGTPPVTVLNPTPGGGTSNAVTFTVTPAPNPVPAVTSLSPNTAAPGGPAFTLTVTGSGFVAASTVRWNGANRTTTFVSSTQLQAAIPATDIATAGTPQVTVLSPTPGGGTSNALPFTITAATATYLSDLTWVSASNGWGPVERDRSNGESLAADGGPLAIRGTTYPKGLGVHAASDITYALNGLYTTFLADLGVDNETGGLGSVVFQVWLDGVKQFESAVLLGTSPVQNVTLDVTAKTTLRLVVTNAGDNSDFDHADWAGARLLSAAP